MFQAHDRRRAVIPFYKGFKEGYQNLVSQRVIPLADPFGTQQKDLFAFDHAPFSLSLPINKRLFDIHHGIDNEFH